MEKYNPNAHKGLSKWFNIHKWQIHHSAGANQYYECAVCGKRKVTMLNTGGYTPIDIDWLNYVDKIHKQTGINVKLVKEIYLQDAYYESKHKPDAGSKYGTYSSLMENPKDLIPAKEVIKYHVKTYQVMDNGNESLLSSLKAKDLDNAQEMFDSIVARNGKMNFTEIVQSTFIKNDK